MDVGGAPSQYARVNAARVVLRALGRPADWALGAIGVLFGAHSCFLPFGHDQGLYFYVGREWLHHGAIPYRDVFDHKTPGIYALHYLTIALFGERQSSIRIADLLCIIALGWIAARVIARRGEPIPAGHVGIGVVVASLVHYGFFNYWDTAQSELWYATLGLGAICAALRIQRADIAAPVAGLLTGLALVMKPPALMFGMVALGVSIACARPNGATWRGAVFSSARFAAGVAVPLIVILVYFGAHGALGAMFDIVVGANAFYVTHEVEVDSFGEAFRRVGHFVGIFFPFSLLIGTACVGAGVFGIRKRDRAVLNTVGMHLLLGGAAFACVAVQKKFYWIHWMAMIAPLTVAILHLATLIASRLTRWPNAVASFCVVVLLFAAYAPTGAARYCWSWQSSLVYRYLMGKTSREAFARAFEIPRMYYFYGDIERVGDYIREHSSPDETILVRGFNPEVYAVARRRYGGRFFWSNFLVDPRRAYRREDYFAEDDRAFVATKPRYIVTLTAARGSIDATDYYLSRGYARVNLFGMLELLERTAP